MMNETIAKYAKEIQRIIDNNTIGDYTWEGLLVEFYNETNFRQAVRG